MAKLDWSKNWLSKWLQNYIIQMCFEFRVFHALLFVCVATATFTLIHHSFDMLIQPLSGMLMGRSPHLN